jgi:hypothetical protein
MACATAEAEVDDRTVEDQPHDRLMGERDEAFQASKLLWPAPRVAGCVLAAVF